MKYELDDWDFWFPFSVGVAATVVFLTVCIICYGIGYTEGKARATHTMTAEAH